MARTGADPGFQVRGGTLNFFGGISCEKSRFYAKKSCFPILGGGGGHAPGAPAPAEEMMNGTVKKRGRGKCHR